MYEDIFRVFDSWEEIYKARKAKGLNNWDRLGHMALKLAGKGSKDITFSCAHPKHGGVPEKHTIGSTEGNLHFLMGYGNPGFNLAPYHWQVMYPDLQDEELASLVKDMEHPSKPQLWKRSNQEVTMEGDMEDGQPHPYAHTARRISAIKNRSLPATSKYGSYSADPVEGLVYDTSTNKAYKWELIKNSYFAYENPAIVEAMESAMPVATTQPEIPEVVKHLSRLESWESDVYPLVKSMFPQPGSIVTIKAGQETIFGVVRAAAIDLVDSAGHPVEFAQYDTAYSSLDLHKGGETHPSVLYNFAKRYLGVDGAHLEDVIKSSTSIDEYVVPSAVHGSPSPGYSDVDATQTDTLRKSVVRTGHTYRLVVES